MTTAKNLRKTILLGGMSVDEAAEWCDKSLDVALLLEMDWFRGLIRFLMKSDRDGLEFVCSWGEDDYLLDLMGCDELATAFYYFPDQANKDCEILNKFLDDFYRIP